MTVCSLAQTDRVQIQGTILDALGDPIEGIAIFNQGSLEGTVSNEAGQFYIHARTGDRLAFKAVQYESFVLTVSASVIEKREAQLSLREGVNVLDEVVIDDGLMQIDVKRISVDPKLDMVSESNVRTRAVDRMENTFSDRVKQPEEYAIRNEAFNQSQPRFNMINIFGALASMALIGNLDGLNFKTSSGPKPTKKEFDVYVLKNKFSTEYLLDYLKIPEEDLYEFMYFAKDHGLNESMFKPENELKLLEFLSVQAERFKKKKGY